ncbi:MAG: hypothetical protein PUP93_08615 [Rhizonema sp. NSF051]|nr:hypothetical protein [Rhizonema sp. NSF051]
MYNLTQFKPYASEVKAPKGWNKEDAANEVVCQATSKMKAQGESLEIFGAWAAYGASATNIALLLYYIVEMCLALTDIYMLDTSYDKVKAFVLARASGDSVVIDSTLKLVELGTINTAAREVALEPLVEVFLVFIFKALGVKLGIIGEMKLAELIPVRLRKIGVRTNYWTVNDTGYKFLKKLKVISSLTY